MKALSIRQPWAWAILFAGKRIENRRQKNDREPRALTGFRGEFLIHASAGLSRFENDVEVLADLLDEPAWLRFRDEHLDLQIACKGTGRRWRPRASLPLGGIVGVARVEGVIDPTGLAPDDQARWHFPDSFGLVLTDVRPLAFVKHPGSLGFFRVPEKIAARAMSDGRWCVAAGERCITACPVESVDNFANKYPGCPRFRLKTMEEMEERT